MSFEVSREGERARLLALDSPQPNLGIDLMSVIFHAQDVPRHPRDSKQARQCAEIEARSLRNFPRDFAVAVWQWGIEFDTLVERLSDPILASGSFKLWRNNGLFPFRFRSGYSFLNPYRRPWLRCDKSVRFGHCCEDARPYTSLFSLKGLFRFRRSCPSGVLVGRTHKNSRERTEMINVSSTKFSYA